MKTRWKTHDLLETRRVIDDKIDCIGHVSKLSH
jgi:hypothetical protein